MEQIQASTITEANDPEPDPLLYGIVHNSELQESISTLQ